MTIDERAEARRILEKHKNSSETARCISESADRTQLSLRKCADAIDIRDDCEAWIVGHFAALLDALEAAERELAALRAECERSAPSLHDLYGYPGLSTD